jgi:TonB family protein
MKLSLRKSRLIFRRARGSSLAAGPALAVFTTPWTRQRSRIGPFFLSLCVHISIVMGVLVENYYRPPLELHIEPPEQLLASGRYKLTWPVLPNDLPPVQPAEGPKPAAAAKKAENTRPRFRLPQRVVANDPDAASRRQMIWDQAPQVELSQDVRSPNFVEPQLSAVQRLRFEQAKAQLQAPARQALAVEQAPRVETSVQQQPASSLGRDARLRYWTPETQQAAPERRALTAEAAPAVTAGPGAGLDIGEAQRLSRLRYWTPQQGADEPGKRTLASGQAPEIQAAPAESLDVEQFQRLSRLRYQQAQAANSAEPAPSRTALSGVADGSPDLAAANSTTSGGAAELIEAQTLASLGPISAPVSSVPGRAVVGVDPDAGAAAPPRGNRSGSFTAGPDGGDAPAGPGAASTGDGGAVAGILVPNLSVTPASPSAPAGVADNRPPSENPAALNTDRQTLLNRFRQFSSTPAPAVGVLAPERPPDPDFPFPGRAVYSLAVNMPNISSYSGSWIIQFAEVGGVETAPGQLSAPSPRVKVDPVYSRAAIDERIEGEVVLHAMIRSDGLVDHIEILKTLDARLDESAKAALSKWRFDPATKQGVPVDVETIVRIPFRLLPRDEKKR